MTAPGRRGPPPTALRSRPARPDDATHPSRASSGTRTVWFFCCCWDRVTLPGRASARAVLAASESDAVPRARSGGPLLDALRSGLPFRGRCLCIDETGGTAERRDQVRGDTAFERRDIRCLASGEVLQSAWPRQVSGVAAMWANSLRHWPRASRFRPPSRAGLLGLGFRLSPLSACISARQFLLSCSAGRASGV